ncbi:Ni/Fe hydrogenase subunit alpha [Nannocystaceae bacterium ST9]
MSEERVYRVEMLARVEGEGRFWLRLGEQGEVLEAKLQIFEAPRYFEALLRGRSYDEVPDIVARICGICPIAYQLGAARALERALGLDPPSPGIRALRRLIYCGEWIESHALHVFMLHAPDFLGFESAIAMAGQHRELVERGLRIKKVGNRILEVLGGRAIHPVSPRIGGFSRTPTPAELQVLRPELARALDEAEATVEWTATLAMPDHPQDYLFAALSGDAYPLEWGDVILLGDGRGPAEQVAVDDWLDRVDEHQVDHSNALQSRLRDTGRPYLVGPLARINHGADKLHPRAQAALERSGLRLPVDNPHRSIVVRSIEIVHALAEALDIVDRYTTRVEPAFVEPSSLRAGVGIGCTEAPRGLCWHRYELDDRGLIRDARIVPPTSQNQARIEQDLIGLAPRLIALDHAEATALCERVIRAYDPCISCATHFLRLEIERCE